MEKANTMTHPFGSATYAAKRAANIVAVLCGKDTLNYQQLIDKVNETLKTYGEHSEVTSADLDELKTVSRRLYTVLARMVTRNGICTSIVAIMRRGLNGLRHHRHWRLQPYWQRNSVIRVDCVLHQPAANRSLISVRVVGERTARRSVLRGSG